MKTQSIPRAILLAQRERPLIPHHGAGQVEDEKIGREIDQRVDLGICCVDVCLRWGTVVRKDVEDNNGCYRGGNLNNNR